jgi:hypothetical protein
MDAGDAAVMSFVSTMPKADRWILRSWRDHGYEPLDALAESRLLVGGRRHPLQQLERTEEWHFAAQREHPTTRARRQTAEHEAAHCWAALQLGLAVYDVRMNDGDGNGGCRFVEGPGKIDNAAVYLAGGMWIRVIRSGRFPGGATGCRLDHEAVLRRVDDMELQEAQRRAHAALYERQADILALADRLERDGTVKL